MLFHNFVLRKINYSNVYFYSSLKISKKFSIFGQGIFKDLLIFVVAFKIGGGFRRICSLFLTCRLFQRVNSKERVEQIKRGKTVLYGISDSSCLLSICDYFFPKCWCKMLVQFYKLASMKRFEF